jgi:hypothetical protein
MADDDRDAAENYRQQRQLAIAATTGFTPKTAQEQLQWIEGHGDLIFAVQSPKQAGQQRVAKQR